MSTGTIPPPTATTHQSATSSNDDGNTLSHKQHQDQLKKSHTINVDHPQQQQQQQTLSAPSQHFILSQSVVRNLQDKTKEKRRSGGEEIELLVRKLHFQNRDKEGVERVLRQLQFQFCESQSSVHARKGGLWGLASACIALQNVITCCAISIIIHDDHHINYYHHIGKRC